MAIQNNEGKSCDAVLRILEKRTRKNRDGVSCPERSGIGPPVELRLNLGTQSYAIEHTQIEAFAGQIHTAVEFGQFIRPVVEELSETLPGPAVYHLYFPIDARVGVNANELDELRGGLIGWVREHAQRLHEKNPERSTKERTPQGIIEQYQGTPPGFPYEVVLRREAHWARSAQHDGVLFAARIAPEDVEARRVARLGQALERKCPKLQRCKEDGDRTVLVLEDSDMFLSNHVLIGDGLAGLLEDRANLPDEIYLVETSMDTWLVRLMKYDERYLPEEPWTEFDSAELTNITGA